MRIFLTLTVLLAAEILPLLRPLAPFKVGVVYAQSLGSPEFVKERESQKIDSATDARAKHILDEPGIPTQDPDEVFDYLDGLPSHSGDSVHQLHNNPQVSWVEAHQWFAAHDGSSAAHRANREHILSAVSQLYSDTISRLNIRSRSGLPLDAHAQHGYVDSEYLGSPNSYYNRIQAVSSTFACSLLEAKQSWEPNFDDRLSGFFSLIHPVDISDDVSLHSAIAGDYVLSFANGLLFGGGVSSAKSFDAAKAVESRSFGTRGSLSNNPFRSLRGAAAELRSSNTSVTLFASEKSIDANIQNDTIQTLYPSAYYRTNEELAAQGTARVQTLGVRASVSNEDTSRLYISAGATAYQMRYDHPLLGTQNNPFIGTSVQSAGVDLLAVGGNFSGMSEAAMSANDTARRFAVVSSWLYEPSDRMSFSVQYRHIPYGFIAPFGEISGSSLSSFANRDGIYLGVQGSPIERLLRFSGYADFTSALVPIRDLFPNQKHDYLGALYWTPTNAIRLTATMRAQSNVSIAAALSSNTFTTVLTDQTNIRLEAAFDNGGHASSTMLLSEKTRYEHVHESSSLGHENGFLVLEEMKVMDPRIRTMFSVSAARFETNSYLSAVYLYEPGAFGSGTSTPLDGGGWRYSIRSATTALAALIISIVIDGTVYDAPRLLGSGLTARTGSAAYDVAFQIDLRL
ncbi:MAG TPA: hypothetical protein VG537_04200 [Candidatus Kapabacteria bacterium]|nr:hypothetical protein [Candidatus Kapabacteria bacterium]